MPKLQPIVHLEVTHRVVNGMMTALDEMNPIELEAGATHGVITSEYIHLIYHHPSGLAVLARSSSKKFIFLN